MSSLRRSQAINNIRVPFGIRYVPDTTRTRLIQDGRISDTRRTHPITARTYPIQDGRIRLQHGHIRYNYTVVNVVNSA